MVMVVMVVQVMTVLLLLMLRYRGKNALERASLHRDGHAAAFLRLDEYCFVGGIVEGHLLRR